MELQPGAYFKVGQEGFEYVGVNKSSDDPTNVKVVARTNPDESSSQGALHRIFEPAILEKDGVKIGPFGEVFPYSSFVAEKAAWEENFSGVEQEIPYPPQELVDALKRVKEQGVNSFEPHYLPPIILKEEDDYPGWKVKPLDWYWGLITVGNIDKDAAKLPGAWVIVDGMQKPNYANGNQMYEDDFLVTVLNKLRDEGKIHNTIGGRAGSRFDISFDEISQHVNPVIAKLLGVDANQVRLPKEIEFNVLGNMFHPEWGNTSTYEWLEDKFGGGSRLFGGGSEITSLSRRLSRDSLDRIGFRPLIVFSQQP